MRLADRAAAERYLPQAEQGDTVPVHLRALEQEITEALTRAAMERQAQQDLQRAWGVR